MSLPSYSITRVFGIECQPSTTSPLLLHFINQLDHLFLRLDLRKFRIHIKEIIVIDGFTPITTRLSHNKRAEPVLHRIRSSAPSAQSFHVTAAEGQELISRSHTTTRRIPTQNSRITTHTRQQATQTRPKEQTGELLQDNRLILQWLHAFRKLPK